MEKLQPKCEKGYSHWSNCKLIKKDGNYLCSKCPFTSCHKCNSFVLVKVQLAKRVTIL